MRYAAEIILADLPGPESEEGMPCYRLDGDFVSPADARDAAIAHIKTLDPQRPVGGASYRLLDSVGNEVVFQGQAL